MRLKLKPIIVTCFIVSSVSFIILTRYGYATRERLLNDTFQHPYLLINQSHLLRKEELSEQKSQKFKRISTAPQDKPQAVISFRFDPKTKRFVCSFCPSGKCSSYVKRPTGNALIDCYLQNDRAKAGEEGRGIVFPPVDIHLTSSAIQKHGLNVNATDLIPLNRLIPDSRPIGCKSVIYGSNFPSLSVIIPFYNEWPSLLLRTIYSIINRTPSSILHEIVLVNDGSTDDYFKRELPEYIQANFPPQRVHLVALPNRKGLITARMAGFNVSTGEVVSFQDSHVEVNIGWAEPLLHEIQRDPTVVAMSQLDYIDKDSFIYKFSPGYKIRYLMGWDLEFFEAYWRPEQIKGKKETDPLPGVLMCGSGFAIRRDLFTQLGLYDEGMAIWGGENIEMSLRAWLCGAKLLHVPCSHVGHVARVQPYTFPGGREAVTLRNYRRLVDVWMGDYKKYVYAAKPGIESVATGDLSGRRAVRERLKCKPFDWFISNVFPELALLDHDVYAWGGVKNSFHSKCLDTRGHLFQEPASLQSGLCSYQVKNQWFSWTRERWVRSSLHCVHVATSPGLKVQLAGCLTSRPAVWTHTRGGWLVHEETGKCLSIGLGPTPVLEACSLSLSSQNWTFQHYTEMYTHLPVKEMHNVQ